MLALAKQSPRESAFVAEEAVALLRSDCETPMNLAYMRTHTGTGLTEVCRFSAFSVHAAFPEHSEPHRPTLGMLVGLIEKWNNRPEHHPHSYALVQPGVTAQS